MDISELIRQERKTYARQDNMLVHHDEINGGLCRMFARYFKSRASECGITVRLYEAGFDCHDIPAHAWIEYNGKCYDADCPDGVDKPINLPYYRERDVDSISIKQIA